MLFMLLGIASGCPESQLTRRLGCFVILCSS